MSRTVYQTVALVKEIEVCPSKCAIKFHPVKKHSIDQLFLCLEIKEPQADQCFSEIEKEAISIEYTYKLLEEISVTLDCRQQEFELLKTAAERALPVHIQFEELEQSQTDKKSGKPKKYKLCKSRVEF